MRCRLANAILPQGWTSTTVGELFTSFGGGTPNRGTPSYWKGDIPWLSSGDIKTAIIVESSETITKQGLKESSARLCRKGSVIVVVRSGILKHTLPVAVLGREAAINQDIKCFDSGDDHLNQWLALAWRASAQKLLAQNREGTTVQSVKFETLRDFVLPVPPPKEQRRIVAKLEKLLAWTEASRQRLDKIPTLLKRLRQSILAAACSGRLTADWRDKNDHNQVDWRKLKLSELLAEPLSNGHSVVNADNGFPVLRLTCLKNGKIDLNERKIGEWTADDAKRYLVRKGDYFVSRGNGSLSHVGRGGLIEEEPDGVAFPDTLIRVRVRKDMIEPMFLQQVWNAQQLREQIETAAHTTAGIWKISQKDIEGFVLPVPPLAEQREIVRRVEELFRFADLIEERYQKVGSHLETTGQSILAKAFRGGLVSHDG